MSGELFGADGSLTVRGEGIAELVSESGFKLDESGLAAERPQGHGGAEVALKGSLSSGWITQSLEGTLLTGATAGATGGCR